MAPPKATDKTIAKELASVVRKVYHGPERDQLTVNYARQLVEEKLSLDAGFLKEGDWKAKSKQIILDTLVSGATQVGQGVDADSVGYRRRLKTKTPNLHNKPPHRRSRRPSPPAVGRRSAL